MGSRSNQSHLASLHTHVDLIGYTFLQQSICNAAVGLERISFFCHVSGIKDPDSAEARRVIRSSGRLTRTVALVKSKCKTWIVSALLRLVSYEG